MACSPLFGKRLLGEQNGSGFAQLPGPFLSSSLTVDIRNSPSPINGVCLSSSFVVWNAVHPKSLVHSSCKRTFPRILVVLSLDMTKNSLFCPSKSLYEMSL
ncbi:hypothetical protein FKM82_010578 [Ascaphus truei]